MATIKTVEFHCPHCNRKLRTAPYNDHCVINGNFYGDPFDTCPACKHRYRNIFCTEAALALTTSRRVPFLLTETRTVVAEVVVAVFLLMIAFVGVPQLLWGLALIAAVHVLASALTLSYRQKHKDRVLEASRQRMRDPEQFLRAAMPFMGVSEQEGCTPTLLAQMHGRALADMDADRVLDMRDIVCEAYGLPRPVKESSRVKVLKKLVLAVQILGIAVFAVSMIWLVAKWYLLGEGISWPALILTAAGAAVVIGGSKVTERLSGEGKQKGR